MCENFLVTLKDPGAEFVSRSILTNNSTALVLIFVHVWTKIIVKHLKYLYAYLTHCRGFAEVAVQTLFSLVIF